MIEISFDGNVVKEAFIAKAGNVTERVIAKLDYLDTGMQAKIVGEHLHGPTGPTSLQQRTGKAAGSIRVVAAVQVGTSIIGKVEGGGGPAWYLRLHEFGVKGPWAINPVRAKALRFEINGHVVFAKYVFHPGLPERPVMRSVLEESKEAIVVGIQDAIAEGLNS